MLDDQRTSELVTSAAIPRFEAWWAGGSLGADR
jgi:hypothetical protein